jgi:hypothetical protein
MMMTGPYRERARRSMRSPSAGASSPHGGMWAALGPPLTARMEELLRPGIAVAVISARQPLPVVLPGSSHAPSPPLKQFDEDGVREVWSSGPKPDQVSGHNYMRWLL